MRGKRVGQLPTWPVGTAVKMVNCLEAENRKDQVFITNSEPWMLSGHTPVVMLEGYRGCFGTNFLQVVNN